jgi:5'-3' exonuclease
MKNENQPILIIDFLNIFTRHFTVNPTLNKDGIPVGGVIGFMNNLKYILEEIYPKNVVIVYESGGSPRRRAIFKDYKANRKPPSLNRFYADDEMKHDATENRMFQIGILMEMLKKIPVCQIYVKNCEADDVIGYISRYKFPDDEIVILSSDKDFYQLLDDKTTIYSPTSKKFVKSEDVFNRFGIYPVNFCLARTMMGDPSDNIDGVKGAGFKTLIKRIPQIAKDKEFEIDMLFKICKKQSELSKIKVYNTINESHDIIRRNWQLMYLGTDNLSAEQIKKINYSIDTFEPKKDKMNLFRLMLKQGLSKFDVERFFFILNFTLKN